MGSTEYGLLTVRNALIKRGLIAKINCKSQAEIEANGGTVLVNVASIPTVKRAKTVIARLRSVQAGAMTVKINAGQTITIAAGSIFGSYNNATAFDADDIQIDDWHKFDYVMIFSLQQSAAELTAWEDGSMWNYMRPENCSMYIDGRAKHHDPTNFRILDTSGNKNHVDKGDGAGTGEPTKRNGLGYTFDGVDDYIGLPDRTSKFPYMYLQIAGVDQLSTSTAVYDSILTSGSFTGRVYAIGLFNTDLNATQIIDFQSFININEVGA